MSVPFALSSAVAYGIADFAGGLAARRAPVLVATAAAQAAGLVSLLPLAGLLGGQPSLSAFGFGALAGVAGAGGLLLYLHALAIGPMGVVAPLSAVIGAGLPLVVGVLGGERLGPVAVVAIVIALLAILLATAGTRQDRAGSVGLLFGLAAGVGFGLFFVGLDATPADSGLWPLLAGRATSVPLLLALVWHRHRSFEAFRLTRTPAPSPTTEPAVAEVGAPEVGGPESDSTEPRRVDVRGGWRRWQPAPLLLMVISGVFDSLANVLFLVAARLGDLGVSAVVVSLYPIVVVLAARAVLAERLTRAQLVSAGLALAASALLAAG